MAARHPSGRSLWGEKSGVIMHPVKSVLSVQTRTEDHAGLIGPKTRRVQDTRQLVSRGVVPFSS